MIHYRFKCYLFDVGILGAMLKLNQQEIANQDYGLTKGYFAENYVAQELTTAGSEKLYSCNERDNPDRGESRNKNSSYLRLSNRAN